MKDEVAKDTCYECMSQARRDYRIMLNSMNDFYLLTYYVRSQKGRLCFALRALGATVKLLKIRFQPGQLGPAIHVAQIFHVTDSYGGLDSQTAEPAIYVYIQLGCPDSQTAYL